MYATVFFFSGFTSASLLSVPLPGSSQVHTQARVQGVDSLSSPRSEDVESSSAGAEARRPVEQPDKLILGWRHLFPSDENVTLLSFRACDPLIPGTRLRVGGYSVILECTHSGKHTLLQSKAQTRAILSIFFIIFFFFFKLG